MRNGRAILPSFTALRRLGLVLALLVAAGSARAQVTVLSTVPASPTSATPVTIVLFNACGCPMYQTPIVRSGFTFDVPYGDACLSACLATTTTYPVGLLEPGTYTVRHFLQGEPSTAEVLGAFAVAPAPIPALGLRGAAVLVAALALVSLMALRRHGRA